MTFWSNETVSMFQAYLDQLIGKLSKFCPDCLSDLCSGEKLLDIFKVHGKCEVSEFDAAAKTAKLFFFHHKGAKKARDKMHDTELEGQKLSVEWFFVFESKDNADGEEKK